MYREALDDDFPWDSATHTTPLQPSPAEIIACPDCQHPRYDDKGTLT